MKREFPPYCYYCDLNAFATADQYERHIVHKHPNRPGYPGPADLKALELKPQGMYWEKEISEAEALETLRRYQSRR